MVGDSPVCLAQEQRHTDEAGHKTRLSWTSLESTRLSVSTLAGQLRFRSRLLIEIEASCCSYAVLTFAHPCSVALTATVDREDAAPGRCRAILRRSISRFACGTASRNETMPRSTSCAIESSPALPSSPRLPITTHTLNVPIDRLMTNAVWEVLAPRLSSHAVLDFRHSPLQLQRNRTRREGEKIQDNDRRRSRRTESSCAPTAAGRRFGPLATTSRCCASRR
ncbi:hypothetical protein FKP32DRAFT_263797 [Trametes sanguinea]|nr:hypothetical protein FKP32DRAFT_263797 [Trametes sanguinea]